MLRCHRVDTGTLPPYKLPDSIALESQAGAPPLYGMFFQRLASNVQSPTPNRCFIVQIPLKPWLDGGRSENKKKNSVHVDGLGDVHDLLAVRMRAEGLDTTGHSTESSSLPSHKALWCTGLVVLRVHVSVHDSK